MKKIFNVLLILVVAVAIYIVAKPTAVKVESVVLKQGPFDETLAADGKVRARTKQTVYAFATGVVQNMQYKVGDPVSAGQVVSALEWDKHLKIKSPMTGVISKIFRDSAGPVTRGEPLFEVSSLSDLEVIAEVLTTDAVRLQEKGSARIQNWGGDGELQSTITHVSRAGIVKLSPLGVEEERTEVRLSLEKIPDELKKRMGDNYHVDVLFLISHEQKALSVPLGALFKSGENWAVYVIKDARARQKEVKISKKNDRFAMISEGLAEGETVILFPGDKIKEGVSVEDSSSP